MYNEEIKELAIQLTSMYMTDYAKRSTHFIDIYAERYINTYKSTYQTLIKNFIFKNPIQVLAKEIALTYTEGYISRNSRSMDELIKTFINAYKAALVEINKDETLKGMTKLPKYEPLKSDETHVFMPLPDPKGVKSSSILPKYEPSHKLSGKGLESDSPITIPVRKKRK